MKTRRTERRDMTVSKTSTTGTPVAASNKSNPSIINSTFLLSSVSSLRSLWSSFRFSACLGALRRTDFEESETEETTKRMWFSMFSRPLLSVLDQWRGFIGADGADFCCCNSRN
jgi:hypothetical protein